MRMALGGFFKKTLKKKRKEMLTSSVARHLRAHFHEALFEVTPTGFYAKICGSDIGHP